MATSNLDKNHLESMRRKYLRSRASQDLLAAFRDLGTANHQRLAEYLSISTRTVNTRVSRINQIFDTTSLAEAFLFALKYGFIFSTDSKTEDKDSSTNQKRK
jgi:DNA-binding NarL/FixJ family response regulator